MLKQTVVEIEKYLDSTEPNGSLESNGRPVITLILIPDRSTDWRGNMIVIAVLGGTCLVISAAFYFTLGIWMILPFAGLEIAALFAGLYYAQWKLNYRHIIDVYSDAIVLEKGVYKPSKSWKLDRFATQLHVYPAKHDWEARKLYLVDDKFELSLGEFLSKQDIQLVLDRLNPLINITRETEARD